ncbi:hypothetical protein [Anaerocolumna xylanovorans]|uniref:Uncharacterized protein n=1 Tax=Anaerocolumna xylanovorans DSM 12503 TaxID=1121345 RepID=A0A1M7YDQ5_9FIRM|nr:hypothetical protein [Anaerocolumna xylanovorans]SHO50774.1 hypothetical protein SAMN02745217_02887 [Anaerocolumna xylanovorans DSM 12503]
MKKKYYLLGSIIIIAIILAVVIKNRYAQLTDITYPCVTVDMDNSKILEVSSLKIEGKVSIMTEKRFRGRIRIDSLPVTSLEDEKMSDILFFKNKYAKNIFGSLIYNTYNTDSAKIKMDYIGTLYMKSMKMDSVVIALADSGQANGKQTNRYIIAPAKNLQEALAVYNRVMK